MNKISLQKVVEKVEALLKIKLAKDDVISLMKEENMTEPEPTMLFDSLMSKHSREFAEKRYHGLHKHLKAGMEIMEHEKMFMSNHEKLLMKKKPVAKKEVPKQLKLSKSKLN